MNAVESTAMTLGLICPFTQRRCERIDCRGCPVQQEAAERIRGLDEVQCNIDSIETN